MFSLGNFIESNKNSVDTLVQKQPATQEAENIRTTFDRIWSDCSGNEQLEKYFDDLQANCYQYTAVVCQFNQLFQDYQDGKLSEEEYKSGFENIDQARHSIHNATIDSFNILSRLMLKNGKDNSWIEPLVQGGRVAYGNYAIKKTVSDIIKFSKQNGEGYEDHERAQ